MSGHSRWAKIKRAKGANDSKRGTLFTKLARNITMAAQEGGGDADMNFTLRLAIDKAKQANMPLDNIDRAIKKGTGELKGEGSMQKVSYEGRSPSGVSFIIDCTTDNTNRTYSEIRDLITRAGAKFADAGSIAWQFQELGKLEVGAAKLKKSEKYGEADSYETVDAAGLEESLLELTGIEDYTLINPSDDPDYEPTEQIPTGRKVAEVFVDKASLKAASQQLESQNWQIITAEIVKKTDATIEIAGEQLDKYQNFKFEVEEMDDVDTVWDNLA